MSNLTRRGAGFAAAGCAVGVDRGASGSPACRCGAVAPHYTKWQWRSFERNGATPAGTVIGVLRLAITLCCGETELRAMVRFKVYEGGRSKHVDKGLVSQCALQFWSPPPPPSAENEIIGADTMPSPSP